MRFVFRRLPITGIYVIILSRVVFSSLRAGSGVRCSAFLAFYKVKPYTALYTSVASRVAAIKPYGFIKSIKA